MFRSGCNTAIDNGRTANLALPGVAKVKGDTEQIRNAFYEMCKRNRDSAERILNDDGLVFPTLYILKPEIIKLGLEPYLSVRNNIALSLSKQLASDASRVGFEVSPQCFPVLHWMFLTGCKETGLGNEYDSIMDAAAALLVKEYGDSTCLKALSDMIFMRHRRGLYTYDAEWAFFESGVPDCLVMVADRLLSRDARDVLLARRLLKFLPCFNEHIADPAEQHRHVVQWLGSNRPYLYYTGESCLLCGNPCRYRVSDEAKYLQRDISQHTPLSTHECMLLEKMRNLDAGTKQMLVEYSHVLRRNSEHQWNIWIQSPLSVQIETSRRIAGKRGFDGYY